MDHLRHWYSLPSTKRKNCKLSLSTEPAANRFDMILTARFQVNVQETVSKQCGMMSNKSKSWKGKTLFFLLTTLVTSCDWVTRWCTTNTSQQHRDEDAKPKDGWTTWVAAGTSNQSTCMLSEFGWEVCNWQTQDPGHPSYVTFSSEWQEKKQRKQTVRP